MPPTSQVMDISQYLYKNLPHPVEAIKMQKLLYYVKAWGVTFLPNDPPFTDKIEAWKHGPVVSSIYPLHRQKIFLENWNAKPGNADAISENSKKISDFVLNLYGNLSGWELVALTHKEDPWMNAWQESEEGKNRGIIIDDKSMIEFYSTKLQK